MNEEIPEDLPIRLTRRGKIVLGLLALPVIYAVGWYVTHIAWVG